MSLDQNKSDITVIVLSIMAVLVAGVLSMATITTKTAEKDPIASTDPYVMADQAARVGLDEAIWHIENHGRIEKGSLPGRYCINGAMYSVEWDAVNLDDSTVVIRSLGEVSLGGDQSYRVNMESKRKISFIPPNTNSILNSYYSKVREPISSE